MPLTISFAIEKLYYSKFCWEKKWIFFRWSVYFWNTRERRVYFSFFISIKTIRSRSPTPNTQLCNITTCRLLFFCCALFGYTLRSSDQKPNVLNVKLLFVSAGCVVQFDTDSVALPLSHSYRCSLSHLLLRALTAIAFMYAFACVAVFVSII